ncbi:hypothetical protein [Actinomadura viridis]|uniref:Uncharacterized protein n=1 Tax=Actinomadura viridis TaxID=58110 RepID=A0A931DQP6_9ACTN|nr:hypothetical protein [Actinomadura viridis]MBG6091620.1 hypothetical protein [Actinomadura viridis]
MSAATGTFHLTHPRLDGPAERTVVEPWLTELSHLTVNAYAEHAWPGSAEAAPPLAMIETLSAPAPVPARHAALAEAA